ncbi:uncharacterized protein VTP21DRAFT_10466 [Calcarisporiella thermophila]|uniref:uncharacterized protein n=1 Tax=Calcarisporiella thermophila TaxID=911321 RepID=UPI00374362A3
MSFLGGGGGQFNQAEQMRLQQLIEQKQMRDFMRLYTGLVERCFNDCVSDFNSTALSAKEETCISLCSDKFLKHSERVGQRFAEQNEQLTQQMNQK